MGVIKWPLNYNLYLCDSNRTNCKMYNSSSSGVANEGSSLNRQRINNPTNSSNSSSGKIYLTPTSSTNTTPTPYNCVSNVTTNANNSQGGDTYNWSGINTTIIFYLNQPGSTTGNTKCVKSN